MRACDEDVDIMERFVGVGGLSAKMLTSASRVVSEAGMNFDRAKHVGT